MSSREIHGNLFTHVKPSIIYTRQAIQLCNLLFTDQSLTDENTQNKINNFVYNSNCEQLCCVPLDSKVWKLSNRANTGCSRIIWLQSVIRPAETANARRLISSPLTSHIVVGNLGLLSACLYWFQILFDFVLNCHDNELNSFHQLFIRTVRTQSRYTQGNILSRSKDRVMIGLQWGYNGVTIGLR